MLSDQLKKEKEQKRRKEIGKDERNKIKKNAGRQKGSKEAKNRTKLYRFNLKVTVSLS